MTKIEWTDITLNPLVGCSVPTLLDGTPSPECLNCYARTAAKSPRLQQFKQYQGTEKWDGTIHFVPDQLRKLLSMRSPKKIFLCSMSDMFHKNVFDKWIDEIMAVCLIKSQHTYQILTKRTERMVEYFTSASVYDRWSNAVGEAAENNSTINWDINHDRNSEIFGLDWNLFHNPLAIKTNHLWLGTTAGCQASASKRIPLLSELTKNGWTTFVSSEPLLERVDLHLDKYPVSQVIVGAESGRNARAMNLDDVRYLRDQCVAHGAAFFYKQNFAKGKKISLPELDGRQWTEFPPSKN